MTYRKSAFITHAQVWKRDDPVLSAGAAALGLTGELFVLAATL